MLLMLIDITQPIQVAVYEMKLGLSLVISSALQKTFLAKMEEGTTSELILETIYSFMQFPRGFAVLCNAEGASNGGSDFPPSDKDISADVLVMDINMLEKLCTLSRDNISDKMVTKATSFVDHLVVIQQEQRSFAYKFNVDLENLRNSMNSLSDLNVNYSINGDGTTIESFVALKQHATHTSMWTQKKLLDNLYAISHEITLFLRKVKVTHLNSCQSVKVAANRLLAFFGKFIPNFQKSKESLDQYLLKGSRSLATPEALSSPFLVSKQMEQLVTRNFQEINELEEHVQPFSRQDVAKRSVEESLIGRFRDVLHKGKLTMQETCSALEPRIHAINASSNSSSDPEAEFAKSFSRTLDLITKTFRKLGSSTAGLTQSEDSFSANITQWKVLV